MTWLDDLKWLPLTLCGLLLVIAPISPTPHLLEKLAMHRKVFWSNPWMCWICSCTVHPYS